jgi:hypothetical protein
MALTGEDKQWIEERLEQMEARVLTEFQKWGSAALRAFDAEMKALEDRVKKIEGR